MSTPLIDITAPGTWNMFVDTKGYVHYNVYNANGLIYKAQLPVSAPENQFLGEERVITEDFLLKGEVELSGGLNAVLISYPDL